MKIFRVDPHVFVPEQSDQQWHGYLTVTRHTEPGPNNRAADSDWDLEIEWLLLGGRAEPVSMKVTRVPIRGHPVSISASRVRELPTGTWVSDVRAALATQAGIMGEELTAQGVMTPIEAAELRDQWGPHRGTPAPTAELQRVADAYLAAYSVGKPVTRAVAEACGVSESTAGKRIVKARRAGLLPKVGKR